MQSNTPEKPFTGFQNYLLDSSSKSFTWEA